MKIKKLFFLASLFLFFSNMAFADINIISSSVCDDLEGKWSGSATATALGGIITCKYNGSGMLTGTNDLEVNLELIKQSGSSFCQSNISHTMLGRCDNSRISFVSNDININGYIINDGIDIMAKMEGFLKTQGVKVDLDIDLIKNK